MRRSINFGARGGSSNNSSCLIRSFGAPGSSSGQMYHIGGMAVMKDVRLPKTNAPTMSPRSGEAETNKTPVTSPRAAITAGTTNNNWKSGSLDKRSVMERALAHNDAMIARIKARRAAEDAKKSGISQEASDDRNNNTKKPKKSSNSSIDESNHSNDDETHELTESDSPQNKKKSNCRVPSDEPSDRIQVVDELDSPRSNGMVHHRKTGSPRSITKVSKTDTITGNDPSDDILEELINDIDMNGIREDTSQKDPMHDTNNLLLEQDKGIDILDKLMEDLQESKHKNRKPSIQTVGKQDDRVLDDVDLQPPQTVVAVTDSYHKRVQFWSMEGILLHGEVGARKLRGPWDIAGNPQTKEWLVTDAGSLSHPPRVIVYNQYGKYQRQFQPIGLQDPGHIKVSPDGKYIAIDDSNQPKLCIYTMNGKLRTEISPTLTEKDNRFKDLGLFDTPAPSDFIQPEFCTFDTDCNLYVTFGSSASLIKVYSIEGVFLRSFGSFPCASGICVTERGNVLVADREMQKVSVYKRDGELVKEGLLSPARGLRTYPHELILLEGNVVLVTAAEDAFSPPSAVHMFQL